MSVVDTRETAEDLTEPRPSYSIVFRVLGSDRAQADAQVAFFRRLHVRRVFVLASPSRSGPPNDATEGLTALTPS